MDGARPIAIVTGGARRVGAAICQSLALDGFDLRLTYHESRASAEALAQRLTAHGARVRPERLDLDDLAGVEAAAARWADLPRLDCLVHNASIYAPTALSDVSAENTERHFRINALAPLLLSRALADRLRATSPRAAAEGRASPSIVAMCDMHSLGRPRKGYIAYSLSKASLAEMVRVLARELAPEVRVNGVAPGVVAFPESGRESDPAAQAAYLSRVPLARSGTPEDAAEAVRWLATSARYTSGEILRIDGGRWLA